MAYRKFRTGQVLNTTGSVLMYTSSFGMGWSLGYLLTTGRVDLTLTLLSTVGMTGGIIIHYMGTGAMKSAVRKYNNELPINLTLIYNNDGLGLQLNF